MRPSVIRSREAVKNHLLSVFAVHLDALLDEAEQHEGRPMETERALWRHMLPVLACVLAYLFARDCLRRVDRDLHKRGLTPDQMRFRLDRDYTLEVTTSVGTVSFPSFAFRNLSTPAASVTHNPGREAWPLYRYCRSSPYLLQIEARAAAHAPYRQAEQVLRFYSHGAVQIADNTLARHAVQIGSMVDTHWLYKTPEAIRDILATRATRDRKTRKPLLYVSSDAHNLPRYLDDTWRWGYKGFNGIRIWCEDEKTGHIIHIGGEFTWENCEGVERRLGELVQAGILPPWGDFGQGVVAQVVFISDGAPWLEQRLTSLLPGVRVILDLYHLLERIAKFAEELARLGGPKTLLQRARKLLGLERHKGGTDQPRKGHRKRRRTVRHAHQFADWSDPTGPETAGVEQLLELVRTAKCPTDEAAALRDEFLEKLEKNAHRIQYDEYRRRGIQIGSGAMESLHRQGSQMRLKVTGARWLTESSQAIANLRMLELAGRWDEFWDQEGLMPLLTQAVTSKRQDSLLTEDAELAA